MLPSLALDKGLPPILPHYKKETVPRTNTARWDANIIVQKQGVSPPLICSFNLMERRKGTTIRINKTERKESLKIRLIPQFKKTLKGNTVTK